MNGLTASFCQKEQYASSTSGACTTMTPNSPITKSSIPTTTKGAHCSLLSTLIPLTMRIAIIMVMVRAIVNALIMTFEAVDQADHITQAMVAVYAQAFIWQTETSSTPSQRSCGHLALRKRLIRQPVNPSSPTLMSSQDTGRV